MSNNTKNIDVPALSDRDMELLIGALRCAEGGFPKVDYKQFAEMTGFKNANSASVSFVAVRKKVMGDSAGAATKKTPKKSTPSKRKQAASAAADSDDPEESPTKKVKTTPNKPVKKEEEVDEDEDPAFL